MWLHLRTHIPDLLCTASKVYYEINNEIRQAICPNNGLELLKCDVTIDSFLRFFHILCNVVLDDWVFKHVLIVRSNEVIIFAQNWFEFLQVWKFSLDFLCVVMINHRIAVLQIFSHLLLLVGILSLQHTFFHFLDMLPENGCFKEISLFPLVLRVGLIVV